MKIEKVTKEVIFDNISDSSLILLKNDRGIPYIEDMEIVASQDGCSYKVKLTDIEAKQMRDTLNKMYPNAEQGNPKPDDVSEKVYADDLIASTAYQIISRLLDKLGAWKETSPNNMEEVLNAFGYYDHTKPETLTAIENAIDWSYEVKPIEEEAQNSGGVITTITEETD